MAQVYRNWEKGFASSTMGQTPKHNMHFGAVLHVSNETILVSDMVEAISNSQNEVPIGKLKTIEIRNVSDFRGDDYKEGCYILGKLTTQQNKYKQPAMPPRDARKRK